MAAGHALFRISLEPARGGRAADARSRAGCGLCRRAWPFGSHLPAVGRSGARPDPAAPPDRDRRRRRGCGDCLH